MLKSWRQSKSDGERAGNPRPEHGQRTGQVVNDALHAAGKTNDETGEPIRAEA